MTVNNADSGVNVIILDKEYLIACPEDERNALLSAARLLDNKMRDIKASGKVIGSDRIAVMAGLNIAHELLSKNPQKTTDSSAELTSNGSKSRIQTMQEKIDQVLSNQRELEL